MADKVSQSPKKEKTRSRKSPATGSPEPQKEGPAATEIMPSVDPEKVEKKSNEKAAAAAMTKMSAEEHSKGSAAITVTPSSEAQKKKSGEEKSVDAKDSPDNPEGKCSLEKTNETDPEKAKKPTAPPAQEGGATATADDDAPK